MKIESKTTHIVTFDVQYFESTEGGMDSASYGKTCTDIGSAIEQLRLAKIADPDSDWIITCDVQTQVNSYESKDKS
jgi:hypothetical protein